MISPSRAPIQLQTFVFGPRNPEGRDFQLLAQSGSIEHLSVEAQGLIYDVPLLLSGWGSSGERQALFAVALGPLPAPYLLIRAALLGRSGIGVRTFGHGILLDPAPDGAPPAIERLASLVPPPDGSTRFGAVPLAVNAEQMADVWRLSPARTDWAGLDLAWRDRIIIAPDQGGWPDVPDAIIMAALAAIDPPEQRARIGGWSTSAAMEPVGRFDPRRLFQLVLADSAAAVAGYPRHLPYQLGSADNLAVKPPPSYGAWQELAAMLARHPDPGVSAYRLSWLHQYSDLDEATARITMLGRIAQAIDGRAMMTLIAHLLGQDMQIAGREGWRSAAATMFRTMISDAADERAAPWFLGQAANFGEAERSALFAEGWEGIAAPLIATLDNRSFERLDANGLVNALPLLEGFETYLEAAPAWQVAALVDRAGATTDIFDDRLVARLVRKMAVKSAKQADSRLGTAIEGLVDRHRERAVGLALSLGVLRSMQPLKPTGRTASARALLRIFPEVNDRSLPRADQLRAVGAALELVNGCNRRGMA